MSALPNPGSDEAVKQGCTCPVVDNNRGLVPPVPPHNWWISEDCPMHDFVQQTSMDNLTVEAYGTVTNPPEAS